MEELSKHLNSIKIVQRTDKVYKDECVYSFDTPVRESISLFFIFRSIFLYRALQK